MTAWARMRSPHPPAAIDGQLDSQATPEATSRPKGRSTLGPGCIVEVRSRFQNRWVDGFEVVEIVEHDGIERYRLARHADHVQLPVLFDACDLRPLDVVDEIVIETEVSAVPGDPGSHR